MTNTHIFQEMIGETFIKVRNINDEEISFEKADGTIMEFFHEQDCCESVRVEEIIGDLSDLENSPILEAEEISEEEPSMEENNYESYSWTFYKFRTIKGSVTIRWLGTSNGCYSEAVDFAVIPAQ